MKRRVYSSLIIVLVMTVVLTMAETLDIKTRFIGNMSIPSRSDSGDVELNEKFEWFKIKVDSNTVPFEIYWLNGTNVENLDTFVETPDGRKIKLSIDYTDRVVIESSEVGNYTVYSRGTRIGEAKGFIRVKCDYCQIINTGRAVMYE